MSYIQTKEEIAEQRRKDAEAEAAKRMLEVEIQNHIEREAYNQKLKDDPKFQASIASLNTNIGASR